MSSILLKMWANALEKPNRNRENLVLIDNVFGGKKISTILVLFFNFLHGASSQNSNLFENIHYFQMKLGMTFVLVMFFNRAFAEPTISLKIVVSVVRNVSIFLQISYGSNTAFYLCHHLMRNQYKWNERKTFSAMLFNIRVEV